MFFSWYEKKAVINKIRPVVTHLYLIAKVHIFLVISDLLPSYLEIPVLRIIDFPTLTIFAAFAEGTMHTSANQG
jgi:hypothetical protein